MVKILRTVSDILLWRFATLNQGPVTRETKKEQCQKLLESVSNEGSNVIATTQTKDISYVFK